MILYTLGTIIYPFDRAIKWLDILLVNEVITEPVLLQYGSTSAKKINHNLLTKVTSLSRNEMKEAINKSSLVISHAGQGSTRMLAEMRSAFVLLPRLKRYKEHIDDHQVLFAKSVEKYGVCYCTELVQLIEYINYRPAKFKGNLFSAPLLSDYLATQY